MDRHIGTLARSTRASMPRRDVLVALGLKGILLLAIYLLFFGPAHRAPSDAAATAAALIGPNVPEESP
jgi:hypothetical protein